MPCSYSIIKSLARMRIEDAWAPSNISAINIRP